MQEVRSEIQSHPIYPRIAFDHLSLYIQKHLKTFYELELSDLDQNCAQTRHLLFKTFEISNLHVYNVQ